MGILDILGGTAGDAISKPIDAIGNVLGKVVTTDKDRLAAEQAMEILRQHPHELQVEINKLEAQSRSNFVAGARPAIMWICAVCIALYYIPQFIIADYLWLSQSLSQNKLLPFPIDASDLMNLTYLILGLGGYRSIEKKWGKTK